MILKKNTINLINLWDQKTATATLVNEATENENNYQQDRQKNYTKQYEDEKHALNKSKKKARLEKADQKSVSMFYVALGKKRNQLR